MSSDSAGTPGAKQSGTGSSDDNLNSSDDADDSNPKKEPKTRAPALPLTIQDEPKTLHPPTPHESDSPMWNVDDADLVNSSVRPSWVQAQGWPPKTFTFSFHPSSPEPQEKLRGVKDCAANLEDSSCGRNGQIQKSPGSRLSKPAQECSGTPQAAADLGAGTSAWPTASSKSDDLNSETPTQRSSVPTQPCAPPPPNPTTPPSLASMVLARGHVLRIKKKKIQVGKLDSNRTATATTETTPALTQNSSGSAVRPDLKALHGVATVPAVEAIAGKIMQHCQGRDAFLKRQFPEGTASSPSGVGNDVVVPSVTPGEQKDIKVTLSEKSASSYIGNVVGVPKQIYGSGTYLSESDTKIPAVTRERRLPHKRNEARVQGNQQEKTDSSNSHYAKVGEFLYHLYERDQLTDVIVHCGSYTFSAHAVVLSCHSPFFAQALMYAGSADSRHHVVLATEVSATAFHVLLDYMYTGDLSLDHETVAELLSASVMLRMNNVEERCRLVLDQLSPERLLIVWEMAKRTSLDDIAEKAIQLLGKNFKEVIGTISFLNLGINFVTALLSRDDLQVSSEIIVGEAAARWLNHDLAERSECASRVMACVRLPLMTSKELFDMATLVDFIFKEEDVMDSFLKANWYVTCRDIRAPCILQMEPPRPRCSQRATSLGEIPLQMNRMGSAEQKKAPVLQPVRVPTDGSSPPRLTRLVLVGGLDPANPNNTQQSRLTMTYNRAGHVWAPYNLMPVGRAHHACVLYENGVFVIGGVDPTGNPEESMAPLDTVFRYDVKKNVWQTISPMNTARAHHSACVLHDKIYVLGGRSNEGILSSVERYDPQQNRWTDLPPMTSQRLGSALASFNDHMMVAGGYGGVESDGREYVILDTVECYDPGTNSWSALAPLRVPRCHASLVNDCGVLYLCGGLAPSLIWPKPITSSLGAIDVYCEHTDTWRIQAELTIPRHQTSAAVLDGKLYVVGGMSTLTNEGTPTVECYDTASGTWDEEVTDLPAPTVGTALLPATLPVHDGRQLVGQS